MGHRDSSEEINGWKRTNEGLDLQLKAALDAADNSKKAVGQLTQSFCIFLAWFDVSL